MKILSVFTIKDYSNTIGEWNEVDEIMKMPIFVQEILGQNILNPKWTWKNRFFTQIFMTALIIFIILGTIDYLKDATDVTSLGEACFTFLITGFFVIKYLLFINTRGTFQKLYLTAKTTLFRIVEADSAEKSKNMLDKMKLIVKMLFLTVNLAVFLRIGVAIWNYVNGIRVTLSKTTNIIFLPKRKPYQEIGMIFQSIYLYEIAFSHLIVDTWFIFLVFFFCQACDSTANLLKVELKKHDESDLEYAERLNNSLRMFYKNHEQLMKYLNNLNVMYKWLTLIPLVCTSVNFCLLLFVTSKDIQWMFLYNLLPTVMEIFAYCWFGEQVQDKGIQFNMALLNFDWLGLRLKDRKNYLILITYMNKELQIKTAVGNVLSLITMTSVLKASYQACALLESMKD